MAQLAAAAIPAIGSLFSGITEQVGGGIREWKNHEYKMEEMIQDTDDQIKILKEKSELTKAEAEKLLDLELKKMKYESELYEMRSKVDINKAREMAKIDMEEKEKMTDQELRILNTKYAGDADLLKLKSNQILSQQAYQPTYFTPSPYGYPSYNFGGYGPTSTPATGMTPNKRKKIKEYRAGLTGHEIQQY
jgi:hypothetical protein